MIPTCLSTMQLLFDSCLPMLICCSLATHILFITRGWKGNKLNILEFFSSHIQRHHPHIACPISTHDTPASDLPMSNSKTPEPSCHGVAVRARRALDILIQSSLSELPQSVIKHATNVEFLPGSTGDMVCFPCPLQEQEAGSALKALEGGAIAAIAELIEDKREPGRSSVKVHLERVTCFLMSAYMVTINDRGKQHPGIKELVRGSLSHCSRAYAI